MNWIIYAVACVFLYGVMHFFIKLSSGSNPVASSMFFITAQFIVQILLGAYFISRSNFDVSYDNIKYGIAGGIAAAIATILYFLAIQQAPLSKVVPIVNMSVVVAVVLGITLLRDVINLRVAAGIIFAIMSIYLLSNSS